MATDVKLTDLGVLARFIPRITLTEDQPTERFQRFFNKEARRSRFKKKDKCRDAFYVANDKFRVDGKAITLPRIGKVRMRQALRFAGKVTGATVSRTADRWFVAISVEVDLPLVPCENQARTVGVDLGVGRLATLSDGTLVEGPKPLRSTLKRLARLNRRLHRKAAGSSNRAKAAMGVARCHARVVSMRGDALHKLTTSLVCPYGRIVIEDLNVKGMVRNRRLGRAVSDMGLGEFRRQLAYKAQPSVSEIVMADRWFPSSKSCRLCGALNDGLRTGPLRAAAAVTGKTVTLMPLAILSDTLGSRVIPTPVDT